MYRRLDSIEMWQLENIFLDCLVPIFLYVTVFTLVVRIFCDLTMGWNTSNVCLVGKTILITGGNSGLGYQTALMLAGRGARIIIADKNDSTESKAKIIEETKNSNVVTKFVDLADLNSIKRFAAEINNEEERLDVLINNAGIGGMYIGYTKDGLQLQMQINHLGPFLLTHLLIGLLKKSAPSRIIFVCSLWNFFFAQLTPDNLNDEPVTRSGYWNQFLLYTNSKLCNTICSVGFGEKLKGTGVTCNALHPGLAKTPLTTHGLVTRGISFLKPLGELLMALFGKTHYQAAQTHAYLAMAEEVTNITGKYFIDCRLWFQPWKIRDKGFCEAIWKKSEELVKLAPHEKL